MSLLQGYSSNEEDDNELLQGSSVFTLSEASSRHQLAVGDSHKVELISSAPDVLTEVQYFIP